MSSVSEPNLHEVPIPVLIQPGGYSLERPPHVTEYPQVNYSFSALRETFQNAQNYSEPLPKEARKITSSSLQQTTPHQTKFSPLPPIYLQSSLPPGLEYLSVVDQLIIKQKMEFIESITGFETSNQYAIANNMGQQVYYAVEKSGFFGRNCLGESRPFKMMIQDNNRVEIMRIHRPYRCEGCCFPCFLQELHITSKSGQVLGSVTQNWSIGIPKFNVNNSAGETVLHIKGPFCASSCFGSDVVFDVLSLNKKHKIGKITKKWSGLLEEMCTDADTFSVTFPLELDVNTKAVLLASTFLINFMFFEDTEIDDY